MRTLFTFLLIAHVTLAMAQESDCVRETPPSAVVPSAQTAAKQAIALNDLRFMSSPMCSEMVPGYPADQYENEDFPKPWGNAVHPLENDCKAVLGKELYDLLMKNQTYAEEYNKVIAEYLVGKHK